MVKYLHQFVIKFHLNRKITNEKKKFLNYLLQEKIISNLSIDKNNNFSAILSSSIHNINNDNEDYFIGQKLITLEKYQEFMADNKLLTDWNNLVQNFKNDIYFSAYEIGYFDQ